MAKISSHIISFMRPLGETAQQEHERWVLWLPVGLGLGIGLYFLLPLEPPLFSLWLLPCLLVIVGGVAICLAPSWWRGCLLVMTIIALGFNAAQFATWRQQTPLLQTQFFSPLIEGRVSQLDPAITGVTVQLDELSIAKWPTTQVPQTIRLKLNSQPQDWPQIGSRIAVAAMLMPLNEPAAPHAYDFRRHGFYSGVGAQGIMRGSWRLLSPAPPYAGFRQWIEQKRGLIDAQVRQVLSGDAAQIAVALLNGAQSGISAPVLQAMRNSGLFHILSISGLHLAIVAAFMYVGARRFLALWPYAALHWPLKKLAAILALAVLPIYTLLVGAPIPAVRSAMMTGIVMLAVLVDRRGLTLRSVALSATVILLAMPQALLGASFQLSYAAVTVMIAGFEAIRRYRQPRLDKPQASTRWQQAMVVVWRALSSMMITSLLATMATAPLTLYQFQQANWYGVIANLIGIPLTSFIIMPAGFVAYALMPFEAAQGALQVMGWGIERLIDVAMIVGGFPAANWPLAAWPFGGFMLMVLGGLWLCIWQRRWRLWGTLPIMAGLVWCLTSPQPDIYLAPEFKNWAVRLPNGQWAAWQDGERDYTVKQWQQRSGGADFIDYAAAMASDDSVLRCDDLACLYLPDALLPPIAIINETAAVNDECGIARLIITPLWHIPCSGTLTINGAWLKYHGATSVYLRDDQAPIIEYARQRWGARPWSPGWKADKEQ